MGVVLKDSIKTNNMQLHFKLKTCYNPCDIHYSGKGYEITWNICANCNRLYHKTAKCKIFLEKQKTSELGHRTLKIITIN